MSDSSVRMGVSWFPIALVGLFLALLIYLVADSLSPIILAAIVAYLLNPLVDLGERLSLPRWASIALIYLAIAGILVLVAVFLFPLIVAQLQELYHWVRAFHPLRPETLDRAVQWITDRVAILRPLVHDSSLGERSLAAAKTWLMGLIEQSPAILKRTLSNLVNVLTYFVMIPFVAFFFLRDGRRFKRALIELVPNRYFETTVNVIAGVTDSLGRYLRGVLLEAFALGVLASIGLSVIGLKGAIVVGMVAGFMNLIPYVGAISGVAIGGFVAFATDGNVVGVIIVFAVAQFLDNWIVQPVVLSRSVHLHPLVIFLAVVFGGTYGGLLGMVLAVPITGAVVVTFRTVRAGLRPPVTSEFGHLRR